MRVNTPRPYIIPTGLGFSFGVLVFVLVIVSVNNRNNLIFLFAFFLFSVGLVTMLMSHRNFEKIKMSFFQASILFKNELGVLSYKIENPGSKDSFMIQVHDKTVEHLKPLEKRDVQIGFLPTHYGIQQVPMQRLESRFPLQFLRVWRFLQPEVKITVFPEKINYFGVTLQQPENEAGEKRSRLNEALEKEISHFDRFKPADSPQHINWKMLAKTSDLYVTKFEPQADEQQHIVLRWSDTESLIDIEKRKSQFAFWIDHFYKLKKSFIVEFNEQQITVAVHDQKNMVKALRLLL